MSNPFEKYLEASQRQYANHEYNIQAVRDLMPQIEPVKSLEGAFEKSKSMSDYAGDTAVDATKATMTLAQTGISALDLGAYALDAAVKAPYRLAQTLAPDELEPAYPTEYGQFSKLLDDGLGFNINKAKQTLGELGYSDIRKKQEAELHSGYSEKEIEAFKNQWTNDFYLQYQDLANKGANPLQLEAFKAEFDGNYKKAYAQFMDKYQTSMDKSFGENAAIVGRAFDTVLDNPALGFGAAIESTGYLLPSLAVSRGIAALQGAAKASAFSKAVAAGTGEGLVSALALNEQMRGNSATGTIDGTKVAAGFAGGAVTGLIGGVSNRLGSRFGLDDVDSLNLGTQAKGFSVTRPVLATGQEAGEEFLQGFGESIIPNIAEGKDPLQGLAQELALGTVAGGIMGGATNARSLVSGAGSDLVSGFNKVAEAVGKGKDAITAKTFEELNDPTNKNYDPAKAFNSQVPKINSQDDREREEALAKMESVFGNLETHRSNLINEKDIAEGILKNIAALPPEEQAKNLKAKGQAESLIKDLDARIIAAENQTMDLFEQKFTLGKNQEVQAGVPQYSEEQAKQDIEVLSQQPTTAVWRNQDTDLPVTVLGETQLDEAGQEYTKVSYTDAATGNVSENFVPSSELVQDTTTQQEAVDRVTKHFSKLSLDELDTVAKSPYLTEEQRNSLRYLSETKRAIADMADTGTVTRHIMNGLKGKTAAESHRGLNNYSDMISKAISTKDEKLLNLALNDLGRFAQDHTDKANALVKAHQLAVSGKFPNLQVLRPKNGTWGIVTDPNKFVDDVKRTATGGWNVHRNTNNNGSIDAVTKEATLIQDTLKSLTQVSLSFGLQAVEPTLTAPVSIEALKEANKPITTPTQSTTSDIYSKLPNKSISGNVVQQSWGKLKTATKAVYDKVVISTRIPNTDEHFGNPFSSDSKVLANNPTLIKTNSTKESVEKYIDWVLNSKDARAKWIREQLKSGNLKGKQILYYTELNEPSHATALDYLINKYDWNTESTSTPSQEVVTPTTSTQTEVTEAVNEKAANGELSNYINHSGGAIGSDTAWGEIGAKYGVTSNHYYKDKTPNGNVQITLEQFQEGLVKATEAAKALGRNWSSKPYVQGLLARNWQQVKNADAIFAVAELDGKYVKGGTGYAVAMAVAEGKPIYVFDQSKNSWFKHTGTGWQKTDTPTLTPNFAGIGTRELNAVGEQAIKDVYAKTQSADLNSNDSSTGTQTEVTETVSIEPKEQAKPSITLQEYGNQTIVTFGDTREVLRADDLEYYNDKVNALIADKLLYAVFDERSLKSKQYAGFVKKLKENGFIPVVGLEYILSKEGKNPYEEYKKLTEKSNLNTGNEPQLDITTPVEAATAQTETKDEAAESNKTSSTSSTNDSTGGATNTGSQESGDNNTGAIIEDTTSTGQASGEATTVTNQAEEEIIGTVEFTEDEQAEIDSLLKELDGLLGSNQPKDKLSLEAVAISELPIREEITDAVAKARQAVRELLIQLNFKFVDSPDVNLTDIERVASKYLISGTSNNDPTFLKEAAKALSYAIYFELDLKEGSTTSRAWLERSLLTWLKTGEIPKVHKGIWAKVIKLFYRIMAVFSGKEFENIDTRLENTLNKIVNGGNFSLKPKEGYAPLVFQEEMDNNPLAVQSLLTLIKSGIKFALTGSIAYSDQVPVYRDKNKPLHDMDFVLSPKDVQAAYDYFTQADSENWGGSFTLYDVVKEGKRILGFAIVPKGYIIKNGKSGWNAEEKAPERSYDVYNVVTGLKEGSYYFLGGKKEVFTGVAGITIDLLTDNGRETVAQTFKDSTGNEHSIEVSTYVGGFTAKLGMMRYKDIVDFVNVIPPVNRVLSKPKEVTLEESNTQKEASTKPTRSIATSEKFKAKAATLSDTELNAALNVLEARRKNGDKSPILQMELKAYNDEVTNRLAAKQPEDRFSLESKTLSLKEYVDRAVKNSEWLSEEDTARIQSAKTVNEVINILSSVKTARTTNKSQQKTLAQIKQEILTEVKAGNLTEEQSELLFFLAEKNPALFDSLGGFDFVGTLGGSAAGKYSPLKKLVTIARDNKGIPTVLAHEMLHHMEVFLPASIKQGIVEAWRKALVKAIKSVQKGSNEELVLRALVETQVTGNTTVLTEVLKSMGGLPNQSLYRLFNPSEFWAENASELLQDRMRENQNWTTAARNYLKELYQKLKSIFGLDNNAAILQGLRLTLSGKTLRDTNVDIPVDFVADNKIIDLFSKVGKFNLSSIPKGFDSNQRFSLEASNNLPNADKVLAIGSKLGGILISKGVTEFERWSQDILALTTKYGISSKVMLPYLVPIYSKLIDEAAPTTKNELTPLATITKYSPESIIEVVRKNSATRSIGFKPSTTEEIEDGKVTVLQGVTEAVREEERAKPFSLRNLIKAYFTQKKGDASNSPLVLVKDFMRNLNVLSDLSKYLSDDTKVNTKQKAQVEHFQKFAKNLAPVIARVFQGEFSKDPKNNLVRDLAVEGVLDGNILTAIAVAAYGYLIRYSEPYNTDDSIRDIVRITKDDAIPPQVAQLLRYAGQEAPYVEADLGKEIAKLLGLKALDDSSADLQSRLEKALGNLTTAALNDVGYVSVHTDVSHKAIGYLMRNAGYTGNEASGIDDGLEGTENLHALEKLGKLTFIRVNYKVDDNAPVIAINKAENIDPVKVLRPARNKDGLIIIKPLVWGTDLSKTSPNDLNDILKNSEETKGILDKVFNNDVGYIKPLMVEPEALDAKTKQGTNNSISKTQKELVEEGQKTAFSIRANTVRVLRTLKGLTDDSKLLKQLLGIWVDDDVTARTHITDRESLESKANNEWRTLTNGLEWADITSLGNDEYAEFYDAQYVTQNERMQYLSNMFNMQGSQIHRAMASLSAFKLEIDLTDTSSANENLQRFYQAVGEGLEKLDKDLQDSIKKKAGLQQFFTVDKVSADNYVEALQEYLAGEISTNAIAAMIKVLAGKTPTDTEQKAIALFVEKGGMGIQSLQSLIALAEMQVAINSGQTSFTTTVGLGSDGVNNGVATANILTGVITREMKQQVGMLPKIPTKNDPVPFTNMQEVYAKGKPDYYISFGAVMGRFLGLLRDKDTEKNKQWRDSVQALFPLYKAIQEASLEMRKIAKTWSIPFNYGAGKKSLQRALARGFMSGIYSDMNKIANKAIDLKEALAKGHLVEGGITKEVFDVEMAALRLTAATLQENINNILKRGWTEAKDKNGKAIWKTTFRVQFPKDLTKLNDYNFDEAQVGNVSFDMASNRIVTFDGEMYTGTSNAIVDSLTEAVTALHGNAAWQATEDYAFEYTRVRDLLNTTHTATYMLYENMRTDLIQAKLRSKRAEALGTVEARNKEINASNAAILEEYKKQGEDAVRKAKADTRWEEPTPIKDLVKEFEYLGLTTEELREIDSILKPVAPVLHSALSRETNNLNAGITLATTEDKVGKASDNKQVTTSYVNKYTNKPRTNTSGLSFKAEMTSGIKALAMAVQGIDAYVAAYLQAKFPTLNVHDAGIFGLKYFVEATKYQNEIYLQAMVNYHLNTESVEALMRSYLGLKDFIASLDSLGLDETAKAKFIKQVEIVEDNILNRVAERNPDGTVKTRLYIEADGGSYDVEIRKGVFKGLNKAFEAFGMLPKENLIEALQALVVQAIQQDMAKLKSLKDLKSVHQYSGEGGAFIIGGKGSDLSEAEHLRRIDAQIALLKVKEKTLLQQLEREVTVLDLVSGKSTKDTSLITFLNANKGKEVDVKDIVTILKGDSSLARSTDTFQQQLAIIREIAPLLDGVKVIYEDVANNEEEGIDDYVQGFYNEDTNRITIRANSKYPPTAKLVLHELLHSGLAARITYLQNLPKDSEEYQDARVALQRLESLRKEILSNLVEGVDASKYFELEAAFKGVGGWEAYKEAQESLKNNKEYQGALTRIETLKTLLKEALQKRKEQNNRYTTLNAEFEAERKGLKFGSEEYSAVWLRQQQSLDELKQEQQKTKEDIATINLELKKADAIVTDKESAELVTVKTAKAFLKLHNTLKNTVFTINGTTEINGLTVVNQLIDIHEFISYGLTEQYLQDIMEAVVQVKNTAERKATGLRGYWGIFVKAIGRILKIGKGETIDALSAFAMDVANTIKAIRESNVPRAESTTPTIRKSTATQAEDQVNQMSSIEVMQTLPHTGNADFGLHLNNLAEKVISQVYNNDEVAKAEIDVIQAIRALPAIKAGFNLSQREAAIQHSLELVLQTYLETSKGGLNVGQLWKIYAEAQKNIKVSDFYDGDWSKATAQEVAATQQKYNYVINSSGKGVESLARFISMGLATEEVHNLLGFNTVTAKPSKQKSWFDTLNGWVRYIASWLGGKLVKTSPLDPAYKQLQGLVNNLTALDIRNRQAVVSIFDKAWNLVGKATQPLDTAVQKLRQYATNRDFLRNSKYLPLRTLGSIASLDAKAIGETIPALIREARDKARPNEKLGEAMTALMESTAMSAIRKSMEALIRQANLNAKDRQDRNDNVKKAIMAWFKDNGKHISKAMHKAITYTLLRTDAQSLLTTFGLDKTIGLLLDTNKLKNEIDLVTKDVSQYKNGNSMINQAMRLAYYMVTNKGGMSLSKNPTAIAIGLGTNYQIDLEDVDQALVGQLDVLASLFAMKYTSAKDRKVLGEMYKENPEALHGLLNMHKGFMADAETEFKDNPLNYIKGWMPEIVNPYREVRAASGIDERDQMLKEGWKVIEEIKPHGKFLMVHADIGYQRLVSGAVDLQNSHRKGTEIVNRQSKQYLSTVKANLAYSAHIASIPHTQFDPSKQETGLIPTYDTDGVPMAFNYEMASWVRDKEMERNNNFADLMGSYAGAMYYKPAKRNQSVTVANALFEDYKQNYQKHPNSYIKLSGKSSDPRIVEMWRMLPKDFRQRATELYGKGEPIVINNEAFLLAFGFKKWSITNIWNKPESERTPMEAMFVTMADNILKGTAKAKIAKAGHIWTEAVSKAKDFIVIRSISVLWYNVIANGLMLMAHNINPITIGKEWTFATTNVRAYQTLNSELIQLKANTLAGKGNSATEAQIKRIESQLEANPMSRYINAGLLSSIVEDVTIQQGDYSYDSELKKKIDNVTGWLPDSVKTLGAWAVFSPSTKAYQFLATTTQLSDFVAKVTLAKHLESKGMDFKAAISEASQTFINYDVPQGVGMQYMNDIGLFMFTKFFLRIQAILFKLLDKKAATVLAQHIAVEGLTDIQGILAPSAAGSIGNWPFEGGALTLPGAAMSIAPVNAGLGLAGF